MRKIYLLLLAMLSCIVSANAQAITKDGICYNIINWDGTSLEVEVTSKDGGYEEDITIPESVEDDNGNTYKVTSIGYNAFYDCTNLTSISIPNSVTSIRDWAFYHCTSLTSITIPNSVTSIGYYVFGDCYGITLVTSEIVTPFDVSAAFSGLHENATLIVPKGSRAAYKELDGWKNFHLTFEKGEDYTLEQADEQGVKYTLNQAEDCSFYYSVTGHSEDLKTEIVIPAKIGGLPVKGIGYSAFNGCDKLTSITIPDGVTTIGGEAFYVCSSLTSITIPDAVTNIGSYAFYGCSSLTSITIPKGVTNIEYGAFQSCEGIKTVTSEIVTPFDVSAFNSWSNNAALIVPKGSRTAYKKLEGWKYFRVTLEEGENYTMEQTDGQGIKYTLSQAEDCSFYYSVTGHSEDLKTEIVIPAKLSGFPVKGIGYSAFNGCDKLTSITIPDGVITIGGEAFYGCSSLTSITIPDAVTNIGSYAFYGCSSLTSITIPKGVTNIEYYAFGECNGIKIVTSEIETPFDVSAFNWWSGNAALIVPKDSRTAYKKLEGWKYFRVTLEKGENYAIEQTDEQGVKYTLNQAEDLSFCYSVTGYTEDLKAEIVIPAKLSGCPVNEIGGSAFDGCSNLTSINIPDGVTSIGERAFNGCSSLTSINIPDAVTKIEYRTFRGCSSLTSIAIPKGVTSIGEYAFRECSSLTSITIPSGVTSIGYDAFNDCNGLKLVTSEIVKPFDVNAFNWWSGNAALIVPKGSRAAYKELEGWKNFGMTFEEGENDYALEQTDKQGVKYSLRQNADYSVYYSVTGHSEDLEAEIVIPADLDGCPIGDIGDSAFSGCENLTSVKIGKNVKSIGNSAFSNCASLSSIKLPKELISIGDGAFSGYGDYYCPITTIVIPSSVETIGNSAFSDCRDLAVINFEVDEEGKTSLTSIGDNAFSSCSFTSITIPNSVTTIGSYAFTYNYKLATVILGDGITEIKNNTFYNCSALTSVIIPDGVTIIEYGAFRYCYQLKSIKLPTSLTSMGEDVFYGCQLKSIELPNSFTAIPANLFKDNDFEYIKLGNNVQSIGKNAFGSRLDNDEAQIVIEIATPTPPSISKDAFPNLEDLLGVITVIVPDEKAETAYSKAAVWKEMTYANMNSDVEVTVTAENKGKLSSALIKQHGLMPAKVVGLKVIGAINEEDFNQMRINFKALLRLDLSECENTDIPDGAMTGKIQLQKLTLPKKLQTIGRSAFQGCPYLTGNLDLPASVTSIGDYAFEGTYYTSVTIPKSLKSIGECAFYNLPIKQTLEFPAGMTGIGAYAFAETQIYGHVEIPDGIKELGDGAFRNTQIRLASPPDDPNGIKSINRELFQGCSNLEYIYLARNFTQVSDYAFDGCSSMEYVRLSPSLTKIGEYAFQNTSMEYINVPKKVKTLERGVFKYCKKLESLALPAKLEYVSAEALYGCNALRNLSVEAIKPPTVEKTSMIGVNTDLCLISIPTDSYEAYILSDYWGQFVNQRNDIAVTTEGNGDIAFESVEEEGEEEEAMARARVQRFLTARAKTRGTTEEEVEPELIYVNNGSSVYVPKKGNKKVRLFIIPGEGEKLLSATLDGKDITKKIVDGVYTATADKRNGELVVKFTSNTETEVLTDPVKIGKNGKTTLTSSDALDFSGFDDLKAYVATGYEGNGTIWLTRVKQVPENTPILLKGEANKTYDVPVMDYCDAYYENMFKGSAEENTYINPSDYDYEDGRYYNYFYMAGGQFKPATNSKEIEAGKCYLRVPSDIYSNPWTEDQTVTIAKSGKSSYAPPVDLDVTNVEGLKAYTATGYDAPSSVIWLTRINKIPAGTGVILKGEPNTTYTLPSVEVQAYYGNMFVGNTNGSITINEISDDGKWTNFYLASGQFWKVSESKEIGNNKSYLHLPTSLLVSSARGKENAIAEEWLMEELETEVMYLGSIGGDDEDGTTRIDGIVNDNAQPDIYYNLQGQRVDNPKKGLYIKNGKKIVIK